MSFETPEETRKRFENALEADIDAEIRKRRHESFANGALGTLIAAFGAEAVVRALGPKEISDSLGWEDL